MLSHPIPESMSQSSTETKPLLPTTPSALQFATSKVLLLATEFGTRKTSDPLGTKPAESNIPEWASSPDSSRERSSSGAESATVQLTPVSGTWTELSVQQESTFSQDRAKSTFKAERLLMMTTWRFDIDRSKINKFINQFTNNS